jgi:hypothetical protein
MQIKQREITYVKVYIAIKTLCVVTAYTDFYFLILNHLSRAFIILIAHLIQLHLSIQFVVAWIQIFQTMYTVCLFFC